jgi:WD40 repeat protein
MDRGGNCSIISPTLALEVNSWTHDQAVDVRGSEVHLKEGAEVRLLDTHPEKPWILGCDKDNEVFVWDYSTDKLLMKKALNELFYIADHPEASRNQVLNTTNNESRIPEENSFLRRRVSMSSKLKSSYYYDSAIYHPHLYAIDAAKENRPLSTSAATATATATAATIAKINVGDLRQVSFVDSATIRWQCGDDIPPGCRGCFNTASRIMVLTTTGVVFYDFITETSDLLLAPEKSRTATSAAFIAANLCVLGCSDGQLRVWDCQNWRQVRALTGHAKTDILMVKPLFWSR